MCQGRLIRFNPLFCCFIGQLRPSSSTVYHHKKQELPVLVRWCVGCVWSLPVLHVCMCLLQVRRPPPTVQIHARLVNWWLLFLVNVSVRVPGITCPGQLHLSPTASYTEAVMSGWVLCGVVLHNLISWFKKQNKTSQSNINGRQWSSTATQSSLLVANGVSCYLSIIGMSCNGCRQ